MAFNVDSFLGEINSHGVARNKNFRVTIDGPIKTNSHVTPRSMSMRCDSIDIPGRTAMTVDYTTDWGAMRKIPYRGLYIDVTCSIILSENLAEKIYMEEWQDLMMGSHRKTDDLNDFHTGYFKDYVGTVTIDQFAETAANPSQPPKSGPDLDPGIGLSSDIVYSVELREAYPIVINPIGGSWAGGDIHKMSVMFAYRYFNDQDTKKKSLPTVGSSVRLNNPTNSTRITTNSNSRGSSRFR